MAEPTADPIADADLAALGEIGSAEFFEQIGLDWRDALPDSYDGPAGADGKPTKIPLRADKSLESFKSIGDVAKSFIETKKLVGAKPVGLVPPGDKATPEEKTAYDAALRKTLGVPEQPTGYQIKRPDIVLDGGWSNAAEGQFLAAMHKAGAPPAVVQAAIDFYGQFERAKLEQAKTEATQVGTALRTEWGPNYEAKLGRANRALQEFGGDSLVDFLASSGLGRDPRMVRAWAAVGDALVEHGAMRGDGLGTLTPEEARGRANELREQLKKLPELDPQRAGIVDEIIALTNAAQRR